MIEHVRRWRHPKVPLPATHGSRRLAMFDREHVAAIFGSRALAEAAVEDLRRAGIADEHLGIAVHDPDVSVVVEEEAEAEAERAVVRGLTVGGAMGFVAAMAVVAVAATVTGGIGVAGILAGGVGSLLGGAVLGGGVSLAVEEQSLLSVEDLLDLDLQPGEILVVARAHHKRPVVEETLRRHEGRIVASKRS
jgi:hypothetical protein